MTFAPWAEGAQGGAEGTPRAAAASHVAAPAGRAGGGGPGPGAFGR